MSTSSWDHGSDIVKIQNHLPNYSRRYKQAEQQRCMTASLSLALPYATITVNCPSPADYS